VEVFDVEASADSTLQWARRKTLEIRAVAVDVLIEKIRSLSPEKAAEVEDFVDFLRLREQDNRLRRASTKLSEDAFAEVWDNSEDAVYDEL
jgi:hypothetical protein